jgi:hypothetical protein
MVDRSPERRRSHLRNSIYHAEPPWLSSQIEVDGRREERGRSLTTTKALGTYILLYYLYILWFRQPLRPSARGLGGRKRPTSQPKADTVPSLWLRDTRVLTTIGYRR